MNLKLNRISTAQECDATMLNKEQMLVIRNKKALHKQSFLFYQELILLSRTLTTRPRPLIASII